MRENPKCKEMMLSQHLAPQLGGLQIYHRAAQLCIFPDRAPHSLKDVNVIRALHLRDWASCWEANEDLELGPDLASFPG